MSKKNSEKHLRRIKEKQQLQWGRSQQRSLENRGTTLKGDDGAEATRQCDYE